MTKQEKIDTLKEHDAYIRWKKNVLKHGNKEYAHRLLNDDNLCFCEFLNDSFTWQKTDEGFEFWNDIYEIEDNK